ncbi:MAG: hypothetical protein KAX31_01170, partial [Thermoplasmata archaeon]|nr:hypothetical protein [Thermoplasmata archaeon]
DFTGVAAHNSEVVVTATVYDETGALAVGVPCQFFIPTTPEGIPGLFQGGDEWGWTEYGDDWDLGWWAGYLGSWFEGNATVTDGAGQLVATIDTASFVADTEIPLQFGVGGTGTTSSFTTVANNWWWEDPYTWGYPATYPPMTDGTWGEYYWMDATFTMTDQVILRRAPIAVLTSFDMDTPSISEGDPEGEFSVTFQMLAGNLAAAPIELGEGTADPTILDETNTSATGVYTYTYNAADSGYAGFDAGIGFTANVRDPDYAAYPFNFYVPYIAAGIGVGALVPEITPVNPVAVAGDDIILDIVVKDEYDRLVDAVTVASGSVDNTTNATGVAQITVPTPLGGEIPCGEFPIELTCTKGNITSTEIYNVHLVDAELFLSTEYWDLNVSVPMINEPFNTTFKALNNWSYDGYAYFDLIVDDVVVNTQKVDIAGTEEKNVTFEHIFTDTANHTVSIAQSGRRS